ncbi:hypothetical protein LEP1GSC168_3818 [Leptospira santarosai str. HAI134]|nr:hypothetical protein LEP1GSC168_3818 [Leptospira santarosai str. HAI134]
MGTLTFQVVSFYKDFTYRVFNSFFLKNSTWLFLICYCNSGHFPLLAPA